MLYEIHARPPRVVEEAPTETATRTAADLPDRDSHTVLPTVPLLTGGGCHGQSGRPQPLEDPPSGSDTGTTLRLMRRGHWAGITAAAALGAVSLLAAGCGDAGSALSLDPVAAAATKTQQAGAARVRFVLHAEGPNRTIAVRGAGAIDGASSELTFDTTPDPAVPQLGGGSFKEISLEQNGDYVVYLQLGALTSQLPGGKDWVELDLSKLGKSAGLDLGKLLSGGQFQPSDLLSMLQAEGARVRNLRSATVDGAAATHYRVTIDTARALRAKGLTSPLLAGAAAELPKFPVDVWIGTDGLLRRIKFAASTAQGRLDMALDLYDYGANVTISAPPSSDVFDATQLAQQGIPSLSQ